MKTNPHLLIVDDEPNIRRILQVAFEKAGYTPVVAESAEQGLQMARQNPPDLVLSDVTMPGMSGHEFLKELRVHLPEVPVVLMTAYGSIPQAIQAIRDGASEFVSKPFDLETLKKVVANALKDGDAQPAAKKPKGKAASASEGSGIIAESPKMRAVLAMVDRVAESRATVMIGGESGVGKEVIARALHNRSLRKNGPFVAVSCGALPETLIESELFGHERGAFTGAQSVKLGRFELANAGTLFLDEIGEVPLSTQVTLLRVLQEREVQRLGGEKSLPVDVRLITATHRDLHVAVEEGRFRLDLLYRLQVIELNIPPLRERLEDIEPLARHFLARYAKENEREALDLSPETLKVLQAYHWPGNVRELENAMERATVLAESDAKFVTPTLLPRWLTAA
jgi:DNA-binding NtrC family response regulator